MRERKELIDYGPYLFAVIGLALILFAVYVAGGDELTCARQGSQFNCQFVNRRLLNLVVKPSSSPATPPLSPPPYPEVRR